MLNIRTLLKSIPSKIICAGAVIVGLTAFTQISSYAKERILIYDNKEHVYTGEDITLKFGEVAIENKGMSPIILDSRTLVPIREVMESDEIGATVTFVSSNKPILITKGNMTIEITINSNMAKINGVETVLDVPAKLIRDKSVGIDKTMVPIRFITEALGYKVDWDGVNRSVVLTDLGRDAFEFSTLTSNISKLKISDNRGSLPTLLASQPKEMFVATQTDYIKMVDGSSEGTYPDTSIIEIAGNDGETRFYIRSESSMSKISYSYWDQKVIVDIEGLHMGTFPTAIQMDQGVYVQKVRTSQYREDPFQGRIVFDLYDNAVPREIIVNEDRTQIELVFNEVGLSEAFIGQDSSGDLIQIKGEYKSMSLLRLDNPNRMLIDLANTVNLLGKREHNFLNGEELKSVKIGQLNQNTTRLVIETVDSCDYEFSYDEGTDITTIRMKPTQLNVLQVKREVSGESETSALTIAGVSYLPEMLDITYDLPRFKTVITFPTLVESLSLDEQVQVADGNINTINVTNVNGKTVMTIMGNHIQEYNAIQTDLGLVLKGVRPKDLYPKIIVIDVGHGGSDPGASYNDVIEKNVNLKISQYLKANIQGNSKIKYYFTRESDVYLTLQQRVDIANDLEADFMLSIHNNAIDISKDPTKAEISGLEILTTIEKEKSAKEIEVANNLYAYLQQQMPSVSFRGVRDYSKLFILRYTNMPAIIVEYAFLTNVNDAANLKNESILNDWGRNTEVFLSSTF